MRLSGPARERGAALLAVIWLAVAAAGLALALLESTRLGTPESRRAVDATRLRAALEAAVHATADRLMRERVELRGGTAELRLSLDDVELEVRIQAESGLVDLAAASPDLLRRLAEAAGFESGTARSLAERLARSRTGSGERAAAIVQRGAGEELRPPAGPGLDHPFELLHGDALAIESAEAAAARLRAAVTLGTGRSEPLVELAPALVRDALSERSGATTGERPAGPMAAMPTGERRADPSDLYRLEILATTPGGRRAVRSVRLALRAGEDRPVRIVDWSGPLPLPESGPLAPGA
ncbi:MAG: hypothetical protein NZ555_03135 [Geminicoccaceae bacterium]|nr:hypothetical protein [Geminicoccaceae bacterium]MCX8099818.1 hypothetical protein [Geminicoccaceae bacterium]MDW8368762.1 hypothetical protein [Geminicoccaceae bacterium]